MNSIHVESVRLGVIADIGGVSAFLDALRDRFGIKASTSTMGTIEIYGNPELSAQLIVSAENFLAGWNEAFQKVYAEGKE